MRLKFIFPCLCLFFGLSLSAQKINTTNEPVLSNKRAQFILPAAFVSFETGDSYAVKATEPFETKNENLDPFSGKSKASYVDLHKKPSYTFHFRSSQAAEPKVKFLLKKELGFKPTTNQSNSYVAVVTFPLSFKIIITDINGDSIKEFVLSDEESPYTFYFMQEEHEGESHGILSSTLTESDSGFSSAEIAEQHYRKDKEAIERECYLQSYNLAKSESRSLLKKLFVSFTPNYKLYIKSIAAGDRKNAPELSEKTEEFRQACEFWTSDQKNRENLAKVRELADYFATELTKTKEKKTKELLLANAGIGYLLCRDYERALPLCGQAVKEDSFFSNTRLSTISLYADLKEYDNISQEAKIIYSSKKYDLEEDYKDYEEKKNGN